MTAFPSSADWLHTGVTGQPATTPLWEVCQVYVIIWEFWFGFPGLWLVQFGVSEGAVAALVSTTAGGFKVECRLESAPDANVTDVCAGVLVSYLCPVPDSSTSSDPEGQLAEDGWMYGWREGWMVTVIMLCVLGHTGHVALCGNTNIGEENSVGLAPAAVEQLPSDFSSNSIHLWQPDWPWKVSDWLSPPTTMYDLLLLYLFSSETFLTHWCR